MLWDNFLGHFGLILHCYGLFWMVLCCYNLFSGVFLLHLVVLVCFGDCLVLFCVG